MENEGSVKDGVQEVVQMIFDRDGEVRPSVLLEEARQESSPAHSGFMWDDTEAAHEYRLFQARQWVRVIPIYCDNEEQRLVHITNLVDDRREGYYKPMSVVVQNLDEYKNALATALSRVSSARRSVDELRQAAREDNTNTEVIDRVHASLSDAQTALEGATV